MSEMGTSWQLFVHPADWDLVADNDKFPNLFTDAELQQLDTLKDSLIERNIITDMHTSLGNGITTMGFLDCRRQDNAVFYVQKIKPEGKMPEYRVGSGKIGMYLETINFDVVMASVEEALRSKTLGCNVTQLALNRS